MKLMPKLAILESLDAMDQVQMEKVLQYIREILHQEKAPDKKRFRKQAMEQIRRALQLEMSRKLQA